MISQTTPARIDSNLRRLLLPSTVAAIALVAKLWLTSFIRAIPLYSPHDETNFLDHASSILAASWFGPYSAFTLIKGPTFPIYIATLNELGLNLNTGHQLSYLVACVVACVAIKPIVRSRAMIFVFGILLYFSPLTFDWTAWFVNRSQIIGSLSLLTVACATGLYVRRSETVRKRIGWSFGLGFSLAAFWLTREEGVWILPCLVGIGGVSVVAAWRGPRQRSQYALLLIPCVIWAGTILLVEAINFYSYGWGVTSEIQSKEFISAYSSLERINHQPVDPTVPVPREAREQAYRVSGLARQMGNYLDGAKSKYVAMCPRTGCSEIPGGQFLWWFRTAVSDAGYYDSGKHARAFYLAMADEIDSSCDRGELACGPKRTTIAPRTAGHASRIVTHLLGGLAVFSGLKGTTIAHPTFPEPPPEIVKEYEQVLRDVVPIGANMNTYDQGLKIGVLSAIVNVYQILFAPALIFLALAFLVSIARSISLRKKLSDSMVIVGSVFASGAFLISLLAVIDALSFPAFENEYLCSLYSISLFALFLTVAQALSYAITRFKPNAKRL